MPFDAPFLMTALGLLVAALVARRRAVRFGLELCSLHSLMRWVVVGALIGGHFVATLSHRSEPLADLGSSQPFWPQPWELLRVWHGWRSVGGLFGALSAALLWRRYRFEPTVVARLRGIFELEGYWFVRRREPAPLLALADVLLSVFPLAWALHRVGSVLQLGRSQVTIFDLVMTTMLLAVTVLLWNGRFRTGTYICLAGLTYAPGRVLLDCLRERARSSPAFVGSLTLTQCGFALVSLLTLLLWARMREPIRTDAPGASPR